VFIFTRKKQRQIDKSEKRIEGKRENLRTNSLEHFRKITMMLLLKLEITSLSKR